MTLPKLLKAYEVVLPRHGARPEEDIYFYRCRRAWLPPLPRVRVAPVMRHPAWLRLAPLCMQ